MGNYRFKLSDMVSSGWLYKLREMGRAKSHDNSQEKQRTTPTPTTTSSSLSSSSSSLSAKTRKARQFSTRKSYYFTRGLVPPENLYKHLPDPPRKSSKQRARKTKSPNQSSPKLVSSSGCSCRATLWTKPDSPLEFATSSSSYTADCSPEAEFRADCVLATKPFDQMVSMKSRPCRFRVDEPPEMGKFPNLELPPIITKAGKVDATAEESKKIERQKEPSWKTGSVSIKIVEEEQRSHPMRRVWVSSPGVKLRVNSPKLARRRTQAPARKSGSLRRSLGESTAVVKSSADPRRDFRESMVEMIRANNIKGSKDLEDLLACYLSLNSDEYHDLIINVFKQIWLDLNDVRSRLK